MICSSLYLLVLMSIILQVDELLGKMTGTVYGGQVKLTIDKLQFRRLKKPSSECLSKPI